MTSGRPMSDKYPRIETRHTGRKRYRVVYDQFFLLRPRYFKTHHDATVHLGHWLARREAEMWRPTDD